MKAWSRPLSGLRAEPGAEQISHELLVERSPRPIWLPAVGEPVTLYLEGREKLPARVLERGADSLLVVIVVPHAPLSRKELTGLVLDYANPGGRVRLRGRTRPQKGPEPGLVRIDEPQLIEVVQERRHVRVSAECPILMHVSGRSEPLHGHTLDVSAGGVLLAGANILSMEEQLSFQLSVAVGEPALAGNAQVVRVDGRGRAALQFMALGAYETWRLIRFTLDCQREGGIFRHPGLDLEGPA